MALIDYVSNEDVPEEHLDRSAYGGVSAYRRIRLHNPAFLAAQDRFRERVLETGRVDGELYEFAMVAVAEANDCEYCAANHRTYLAERAGLDAEAVDALAAGDYSSLTPEQRAVVEFADQAARDPHRISDAHIGALFDVGFGEADVIQLLGVVGVCQLSNTIVSALDVELERDEDHGSG